MDWEGDGIVNCLVTLQSIRDEKQYRMCPNISSVCLKFHMGATDSHGSQRVRAYKVKTELVNEMYAEILGNNKAESAWIRHVAEKQLCWKCLT